MQETVKEMDPDALEKAGVKLVVIGCGNYGMIKAYSGECYGLRHQNLERSRVELRRFTLDLERTFHSPFPFYVDPKLELYRAMGMTLQTLDTGPEKQKGGYVKHGAVLGTLGVVKRALANGMPVTKNGGNLSQLGGEFVLGPG